MVKDINKLLVGKNANIYEVLQVINNGNAQIAFVVDTDRKLLGTISDGDIRRTILKKGNLDIDAKAIMRKKFKYIYESENLEEALRKMRIEKIFQIPVIDKKGILIDVLLINDCFNNNIKENNLVIMAGGKGTRLRPYTEKMPKPMLQINGKPMLEIILELCIDNGFRNFYFSVNYLKEQIINYFEDGKKWNVSIKYLIEDKPLGTAGSLQLLPKQKLPFLVINGDLLTRLNLNRILDFHLDNGGEATLGVRNHIEKFPYGIVEVNGIKLLNFQEKPTFSNLVNAGVYVINPELLSLIDKDSYLDMPDFLQESKNKGYSINVCPIHEYWLDVGKPEFLKKAHNEWLI